MQQLFNAADTSVAGYFGNPNALAAVGTNAENVALIVTLSFGLSVGANIIIANRIEKNERRSVPAVTETVVILALIIDVIGFFIGQAATTFTGQNSAAGRRERCKKFFGVPFIFGNIKPFCNCARSSIQRIFRRSFFKGRRRHRLCLYAYYVHTAV